MFDLVSVFEHKRHVDARRVRHEEESVVACEAGCHAEAFEVHALDVDCLALCTDQDLSNAFNPFILVVLDDRCEEVFCFSNGGLGLVYLLGQSD